MSTERRARQTSPAADSDTSWAVYLLDVDRYAHMHNNNLAIQSQQDTRQYNYNPYIIL